MRSTRRPRAEGAPRSGASGPIGASSPGEPLFAEKDDGGRSALRAAFLALCAADPESPLFDRLLRDMAGVIDRSFGYRDALTIPAHLAQPAPSEPAREKSDVESGIVTIREGEGLVSDCDDGFSRLVGRERAAIIGAHLSEILGVEHGYYCELMLNKEKTARFKAYVVRPGWRVPVRIESSRLETSDGELIRAVFRPLRRS